MPHPPLPEELGARFSVAEARRHGVSLSRLRKSDLAKPFHGVRSTPAAETDSVDRWGRALGELEREHLQRARDYAPRMSEFEFLSHVTAAVAWGAPLPPLAIVGQPVHVSVAGPARLSRSEGVRGHQTSSALSSFRRDPFTGLRIASPATTWAMLGAVLTDPYDLIAAGDRLVHDWRVAEPLATVSQLTAVVASGRRVGRPALRAALPRIRTRAASRPETWARLALIDAGLPEPELNWDVVVGGIRIACVDLAYPELKVALEYEGEHHLYQADQWTTDIARYERLIAAGWLVIRLTKEDVFTHPAAVAARVRRAVASRTHS